MGAISHSTGKDTPASCTRIGFQTADLCASAEPLSMHTFEHLDAVGCPVVLACGGGGSPTDFIDRLMPVALKRLPDSRLHR